MVFLAGAPAPPWTALLAPGRSRRQDDQRMLKYTMHEVQSRAEAPGPAHQVRTLE